MINGFADKDIFSQYFSASKPEQKTSRRQPEWPDNLSEKEPNCQQKIAQQ